MVRVIFLLSIGWLFFGCDNSINGVNKVYDKREMFLENFQHLSVFQLNRYIVVHSYQFGLKNEYWFTEQENKLYLLRDSIEFKNDSNMQVAHSDYGYRGILANRVRQLTKIMDSFGIRSISSDFSSQGIDLKFYMKSGGIFVYTSNAKNVNNPEWVKYINRMKKLDNNWFYSTHDF